MNESPIIALEGVELAYEVNGHEIPVLRGVDLSVREGDFVLIRGAVGAGKSALVNVLAGLETPSAGRLRLAGIEVGELAPGAARSLFRSFVGCFAPWFRLDSRADLAALAADPRRSPRVDPGRIYRLLGLDPEDRRPFGAFSARERRLADCARVLLSAPRVVVADLAAPPWGSAPLLADLQRIRRDLGTTIVATVEAEVTAPGARRVQLENGAIVADLSLV